MELEGAGGAVTGGLIASAIERPTGTAGEAHSGRCSDCGAPVERKFCPECGQPTHVHRSLLHLVEEVLHGVMHFDARIWRTLPLLAFNPGRLTREWVQGMRTRYLSPLALFLFTVFLMFFILSFSGDVSIPTPPQASLDAQITATRTGLEDTRASLAEAEADVAMQTEPGAEAALAATRTAVGVMERRLADLEAVQAGGGRADGLTPGSWQAGLKDFSGEAEPTGASQGAAKKLLKKLQNPDLLVYKLQQTMYKYAFLLVPLSIPFMALLFVWKRGFTLYDHGVFVLYSLTFISILSMVVAGMFALATVAGGLALAAAMAWVPVHMFMQLKGAYGLGVWSALWRTFFLLNFCTLVIGLFTTAVVYLGLGL